jgi:hypothetical protein
MITQRKNFQEFDKFMVLGDIDIVSSDKYYQRLS